MGRNGFLGSFQGIDAFGKVGSSVYFPDDANLIDRRWRMSRSGREQERSVCLASPLARIITDTAPPVTFLSFSIILTSVLLEFIDYRRIHLEPSIMVDRSRGEKLAIDMDITFPRVPCYREVAV